MRLNQVLKGYRERRDLSLRELASEIGINQMSLWRFEQGERVNSPVWSKIMVWLFAAETKTKRN